MEIEIISEGCIKPSSPTPPHPKTYKISLLDQLLPAIDFPMLLFYPNQDIHLTSERSTLLKQSLSETLTHYYPLAGRIKDMLSVDCNDEGVRYIDAKANISLSEYLTQTGLPSLKQLFRIDANWLEPDRTKSHVTVIQETIFACGSIAIGVAVSHRIMDGKSLSSFLKCWAAIASNSTKHLIFPNFDGPSIFPQCETFEKEETLFHFIQPFCRIGKTSTRRFVFDASTINNLKAETNPSLENPTRVEVVSGLLLECITAILKQRSSSSGTDRINAFMLSVNLRQRATPPIPESSLGNFLGIARGFSSPEESNRVDFACKLREAIRKFDSELVKSIQDGGVTKVYEIIEEISEDVKISLENEVNFVLMTSWCNFGLYEVDFGWGKPIWVACGATAAPDSEVPYVNSIVLMDSGTDKGVEAWVCMEEERLVLLDKYKQLLQYASVNPNPFKQGLLVSHSSEGDER